MSTRTTEFDHLMKDAFSVMFPEGRYGMIFKNPQGINGYRRGVSPDFVLPDGRWIDFKLTFSFREIPNVPWKPSALYSSLRKYIDHSANPDKKLIIVYGKIFGTTKDIKFPICRGKTVLLPNEDEFNNRIILISAIKAIERLKGTSSEWMTSKLRTLLSK